ncbi:NHL domain-containing thioredoxin family protein [Kocuria sp. p3-SID1433]|uniref:NHL domain-containing thioredoxin family protein n=1 Tax=unclassified Kocuria TaxID=2649579 RepID=UPI0021A4AF41|nr:MULTISPECIES: NHL domain-containing thioredoxin family protein [unclassified Kocuria]MCT1601671.1 NHL domain-containing thioredoxin family protein [Kocuria sp. p3-SID1428]MCT2181141.1 NHL domain-containing thioredoxin family protein [Kocuria sp. p3-SID1433]
MSAQSRVRASALTGRAWLNTGGQELDWQKLRGKIVILDFWSFCCINCLHVLDELRPLEERFSDVLVTVGVHSPKFEHEADPQALAAAVDRYEIHHPVLDDPELGTWDAYTARAWPTLVVVDPEGYIVAHLSGEGHVQGIVSLVEELVDKHEAAGTLHRGDGPYVPPETTDGDLRFPEKAVALEDGTVVVADTGHHRLVRMEADLQTVRSVIGDGTRGHADGDPAAARFNEPRGLALLPQRVREQVGYDLIAADTVNHRLRGVRLSDGEVSTLAGSGVQRLLDSERAKGVDADHIDPEAGPCEVALSSPWDVVWSAAADTLVIAMSGTHQIFTFEPRTGALAVAAGTGDEGLVDGAPEQSWFAQTSGLVEAPDGTIWAADSESSALRSIEVTDGALSTVGTAAGLGLYDFGFRDGDSAHARLQHPLGVAVLPDGSIAVADTYNGAIRRWDPTEGLLSTLERDFDEPSDLLIDSSGEAPELIVVETNRHRLVRLPVPQKLLQVDEGASVSQRSRTPIAGGTMTIDVRFAAPAGQKLDDRWGDPTQLKLSTSPAEALLDGGGAAQGLKREITLADGTTEGVLHITARAAACDGEPGGEIPDHAACHLYQQDWGIPFTVAEGAEDTLVLDLRGLNG